MNVREDYGLEDSPTATEREKDIQEQMMKLRYERVCFVPNWFFKEHFEHFLERELSDDQYRYLCKNLHLDLDDAVSYLMMDWLGDTADEILAELAEDDEDEQHNVSGACTGHDSI
jgi:hypothetical protein